MNLAYQFQKLRKMPAKEIRCRIAEKLRVRRERKSYDRRRTTAGDVVAADLSNLCRALVPGTRSKEQQRLKAERPDDHARLAAAAANRAQLLLSGQWPLLGYSVDVAQIANWHADPRTDYVFPKQFYADLSLYDLGGEVDVKYVWELGRHQYLVELARAWQFGEQTQCAELARKLLLGWIADNRIYEGVHWTSSLELAMRGISWIWTIATLADWDGWQPDDFAAITGSLREQAEYIEHHLSYYSSPYNHLVGEAAGLYLIGCALTGTEGADRWRRLGHRVLSEHGPRQFYADGFCVEQATGYHFYTLGFMSLAIAAARDADEPLTELERTVHRAFHAGLAFRQPGGRWPAIGDVDSARAIPVHHDDFWQFDSLCILGAALFDDAELLPSDETFSEEAFWLLGCKAHEAFAARETGTVTSACILPDAGYAIARSHQDWICFDAGPLGDGLHADATPSTAHGHADTLQILYHHQGQDVLIDPGMPFYFGDDAWVGHFRSPAAHNTLSVEGVDVAKRAGRLAWSHVAPTPSLDVRLAPKAWLMRGGAEWAAGITIERYVLAIPGRGVWIADHIVTDHPRSIRWYWQLGDEDHAPQVWTDATAITTTIDEADDGDAVAWFAPGYGIHKKGRRIRHELPASERALVVTYFGNHPLPLEVRVGEQTLSCPPDGTPATGLSRDDEMQQGTDVVWRLELASQQVTYLAGAEIPGMRPLEGDGSWNVFTDAKALSPAS